ncbi:MAG: DUF1801 domain-containing protein [Bacteroidota bacterium]|nr:DUF1801 domain-containing protein [Bacteroidota bacterium]
MKTAPAPDIDEYIAKFPQETGKILQQVRLTVRKAAPTATETISYGMPAFRYKGRVIIYFAGYKNHIGVYATPSGHAAFQKELSAYKQGRGSVQFPLDQPMPLDLIKRMVQFRVKQQNEPVTDFLSGLSAPARRALQNNGIKTIKDLSKLTEAGILQLHGIGKTAIPILQKALKEKGLNFSKAKKV